MKSPGTSIYKYNNIIIRCISHLADTTGVRKTSVLFTCITALLLISCVEEIDLKLDRAEYTKLIVDGQITDQPWPQTIKLNLTSAYDSNVPCPPATGAEVFVTEGDNKYIFPEASPGIYKSDEFTGEVGKTYTLSVVHQNELYTASSVMHPPMPIDSVGFRKFPYGLPRDKPHWEILIYGQDNPDINECHMFQYAVNGVWQDTLLYAGLYTDWLSNGEYINGESMFIYATYDERVEVRVRAVSIELDYFWFVGNCIWAVMPDMFFSPPRANVEGNITNGALGFFRASAVYETDSYILDVFR